MFLMDTTYYFKSVADINIDILNAIKTAFKKLIRGAYYWRGVGWDSLFNGWAWQ